MSKEIILSGNLFLKMIINGVANFKAHIKEINDLNVFPIPDGDTGENMFMTLKGGLQEVLKLKSNSINTIANTLSNGMLLKARGNSGVILSQLFAGFSKGLCEKEDATLDEICIAMESAVKQAYLAVSQPVEGTMLTVARETCEKAKNICNQVKNIDEFFECCLEELKRSLDNTPDMLPVLKEAGVVDSGGAGLYYLWQGMLFVLENKIIEESEEEINNLNSQNNSNNDIDYSKFNQDSIMKYGYCTECLLQLQTIKVNVNDFDVNTIIEYLETIGDSVVAFKTGSIVKIHVHTLAPYKVLEFCQRFGEFLNVKIENMTLQHNGIKKETNVTSKEDDEVFAKKRPHKKYGLITVAMGKGLIDAFYEMGADIVIDGGQTKNPSVEEFLKAFNEVNADEIFVLPNNSNIILAAKNAIDVYYNDTSDKEIDKNDEKKSIIHLIETKNLGQAYSILSMLDYSVDDGKVIAENMKGEMLGSITAQITTSVRDASLNGISIKSGEYIGFTNKEMKVSGPNKLKVFEEMLETLELDDKGFIVVVYGMDITKEEKLKTKDLVVNKYKDIEFYELDGGQEVYDYILIVE